MEKDSSLPYHDMGNLWPERTPVHVGPIKFVDGMKHRGGGRGVIAAEEIKAGTLLVAEQPYLKWPVDTADDPLNVAMLKKILSHKRKDKILYDMSKVHPTSVDIVPIDMIRELETEFGSHIDKLIATYKMPRTDLIRLFLVLQMSAHSSGLYLHLSLFNHDSRPNSIKFAPKEGSPASEIRAVQTIKKGEEITVSYLEPRERTRARQYLKLQKQFGFIPSFDDPTRDELVEKWKNPDSNDLEYLLRLEDDLDEWAQLREQPLDGLEKLRAMHTKAIAVLDERHILLLRLNKLIVDAVSPYVMGEQETNQLGEMLLVYVTHSYEVYKTQLIYLPRDHIDLATTLSDLAQGIEALLVEDKALLFKRCPQWDTFAKATKFQHFCQSQFMRLDDMYS